MSWPGWWDLKVLLAYGFVSISLLILVVICMHQLLLVCGTAFIRNVGNDYWSDEKASYHSISLPSFAANMRISCALSSSVLALLGFSINGIFVHLICPIEEFEFMTIPAELLVLVVSY